MTTDIDRKLFIGPRLRRLRRELGLNQTKMAEDLGVSPSYVNLMERNQRPVSAQILLRLADVYDIDVKSLAAAEDDRSLAEIGELMRDPLFQDLAVPAQELRDLVESCPGVGVALQRLYQAYQQTQRQPEDGKAAPPAVDPIDAVRAAIETARNHFPELDAAAEALAGDLAAAGADLQAALAERLQARHGVRLRIVPDEVMTGAIRRFDRHRRHLLLSEMLAAPARSFHAAFQVGTLEQAEALDAAVEAAGLADPTARRMFRVFLANYFAGAVLMPYGRFFAAAEAARYDIAVLRARFGASFEQVCHRMTTLQRKGASGIPLHLVRTDIAGNISKRFSLSGIHIPRHSGACPRWNIYSAFLSPERINIQLSQMPDGQRYFCIARAIAKGDHRYNAPRRYLSIGLGCSIHHAKEMIYSDGMDLAGESQVVPIGVGCRICPRMECGQRAHPPADHRFRLDDNMRPESLYARMG